jgi:predicted nucleic acid-binding protein
VKVYVDSSALIKRAVAEAESETLEHMLERHVEADDALVSSTLAWIEISRALRARLDGEGHEAVTAAIEDALAGIAERAITPDVVSLARRIEPNVLRSLDAIHLASAVLLDVDAVLTYDERLAMAARHNGLAVAAPR